MPLYPAHRRRRAENSDRILGEDSEGNEITLRSGRFGPYVQRGEPTEDKKKPDRASLPKGWKAEEMDLEKALTLLSLPREVGEHPEGGMVKSNFGRFGPYVMHQAPEDKKPVYASLKDPADVFEIGMNRAVELLAEKRANPGGRGPRGREAAARAGRASRRGRAGAGVRGTLRALREMGQGQRHPAQGRDPEDITLEAATALIAEKAAKTGGGRKKKAAPRKKAG